MQDLILILMSAFIFLFLVLDAFWHENGHQLLVCMASGGLNLVQLIIFGTALTTRDATSIGVVIFCAVLQAIAVALARWAYLGFGWRMYSKIACDATLPDAESRRAIGLRLDRFTAFAKLDAHMLVLLLIVGLINGVNPLKGGLGDVLVPLLILALVGVPTAALWLVVCWVSVIGSKHRLQLFSEFTFPLCYVVGAAYMFSCVYYGHRLHQLHGEIYLIMYPILFIIGRTCVWWDARLLYDCEVVHFRKGFAQVVQKRFYIDEEGLPPSDPPTPPDLLPLMHGAWLLKLPSTGSKGKRHSKRFGFASQRGRWRYFQLSHDGSTLRWDWRKYVLMVHVEAVRCRIEDCSITLSLTLEPDLRLKFTSFEEHAAWARGLMLLVTLLGNPGGLESKVDPLKTCSKSEVGMIDGTIKVSPRLPRLIPGKEASGTNLATPVSGQTMGKGHVYVGSVGDPGSPSRLLVRLKSASSRPSAAGLFTKEALETAAWQARRALGGAFDEMAIVEIQNRRSPRYHWDIEEGHNTTQNSAGRVVDVLQHQTPQNSKEDASTYSKLRRTVTAPAGATMEDWMQGLEPSQLSSQTPDKIFPTGMQQSCCSARQLESYGHERSFSMDDYQPVPYLLKPAEAATEGRSDTSGRVEGVSMTNTTAGSLLSAVYPPPYVGTHFLQRTCSVPVVQAPQCFGATHLGHGRCQRHTSIVAENSGIKPTPLARNDILNSSIVPGMIMNIEMIDFQQLMFGRMLGQGAGELAGFVFPLQMTTT